MLTYRVTQFCWNLSHLTNTLLQHVQVLILYIYIYIYIYAYIRTHLINRQVKFLLNFCPPDRGKPLIELVMVANGQSGLTQQSSVQASSVLTWITELNCVFHHSGQSILMGLSHDVFQWQKESFSRLCCQQQNRVLYPCNTECIFGNIRIYFPVISQHKDGTDSLLLVGNHSLCIPYLWMPCRCFGVLSVSLYND